MSSDRNSRSRASGRRAIGRPGLARFHARRSRACRSRGSSRSAGVRPPARRLKSREQRTTRAQPRALLSGDLSAARAALGCCDRHFEAVGMSFVEMGIGWFCADRRLARTSQRIDGASISTRALAAGSGVLLFAAHFTTLEVGVAVLEALTPRASCMYRPQRNAMMDVMIRRGRSRFAKEQIPRDNVRALVRSLREQLRRGLPARPDLPRQAKRAAAVLRRARSHQHRDEQARGDQRRRRAAVFLPAPAGTRRLPRRHRPAAADFPSDDRRGATRSARSRCSRSYIRLAPEQYLWLYKKFKGRPPPFPDRVRASA